MHAWLGLEGGIEAVRVTEWDEPQAVFGSYLQRYAYPDFFRMHVERNTRELINWRRGKPGFRLISSARDVEDIRNSVQRTAGAAQCVHLAN